MTFEKLRDRHPRLLYRSYSLERRAGHLHASFDFLLEPNIEFKPDLSIEYDGEINEQQLAPFIFHLGLIELISYWKCACPPEIVIEAGLLDEKQRRWWKKLFLNGLGEFFYLNSIDLNDPNLLQIRCDNSAAGVIAPTNALKTEGSLILTAGGKDSTVTLELLKTLPGRKTPLMLNPTRAALDSARLADYTHPLILRRTIDPKLIELNGQGYLNGHTPFSAYLAFVSSYAAALFGYRYVISSNERSSEEPNTIYHGVGVNHQYSKSYDFEKLFRSYAAENLSSEIEYFSFLRPLFDLQIAKLFSAYPKHFSSFRSCNVGQRMNRSRRTDIWCNECAKCAFVYLSLAPFVSRKILGEIFTEDLFEKPKIQEYMRALVGLGDHKPFECVGTEHESREACRLLLEQDPEAPPFIKSLLTECTTSEQPLALNSFADEHCLPAEFEQILKDAITQSTYE